MYVKVRAEEVLIGATLGAGLGFATAAPFAAGMPSLIPLLSNGVGSALQAAIALGLAAGGAVGGGWLAGHQERDTHFRGAQYFADYKEAQKRLQAAETRQFSRAQRAHKVRGLTIGGVELARGTETGHIYCVGVPRAGKTVLLTSLIDQLHDRGDRLILHDPKGDFIERYYDPKTTVLLGPWDERAAVWDAAHDIDSPALADEFASALCGDTPTAGVNRSFHANAAIVISGLIKKHMVEGSHWTWADLRASLTGGTKKMVEDAAKGDEAVKTAMASIFTGRELTTGDAATLSVLTSASRWLASYAAVDARDSDRRRFSLRKWLTHEDHDDVQIVILNAHSMYRTVCEALFGAMLTTVAGVMASPVLPELPADATGGVFLVCDECPQVGAVALEQIQTAAEVGRSRGLRVVLALQDESQLEAKVGREKAAPMLAVQSTKIYMRCSDRTADAVSKRIGQREILRIDTTAQDGAVAGKTKRAETQTIVQQSDLLGLRVRTDHAPLGVELVMHIESTLGRLVQPFPSRTIARAPQMVESQTWRMGALPEPTETAAGGDQGSAVPGVPAASPALADDIPDII